MRNILLVILVVCSLGVSAQSTANNNGPWVLVSGISVTDYRTAPAYTIGQILAVPKLTPRPPATKIVAYTMSITKFNGDQLGPFMAKGADMTQEMKDALTAVKGRPGTIYIDDIKAAGPDGRARSLQTITIRYTN